jgi:hypothetical protein
VLRILSSVRLLRRREERVVQVAQVVLVVAADKSAAVRALEAVAGSEAERRRNPGFRSSRGPQPFTTTTR